MQREIVLGADTTVVLGDAEIYAHSGGQFEWDSAAPVAVALAARRGVRFSRPCRCSSCSAPAGDWSDFVPALRWSISPRSLSR